MAIDVTLPELGEGIEKADVVRVFVATGETVYRENELPGAILTRIFLIWLRAR